MIGSIGSHAFATDLPTTSPNATARVYVMKVVTESMLLNQSYHYDPLLLIAPRTTIQSFKYGSKLDLQLPCLLLWLLVMPKIRRVKRGVAAKRQTRKVKIVSSCVIIIIFFENCIVFNEMLFVEEAVVDITACDLTLDERLNNREK
jgi:hypothetical protein